MARPKKLPAKSVWEQSIKELLATHGINPVERMIRLAMQEIEVHDDDDEDYVASMLDDYQLIHKDGKKFLTPKLKHQINLWSEIAQYTAPKLRATETKGQIDYNFNITIRKFEDEPVKVIDVSVKQLPNGD